MCDEHTAIEEEAALAARGLSRREFAAIGAAGVLAACTASEGQAAKARATSESMVKVTTPDGTADAFFVHPARGKAPAKAAPAPVKAAPAKATPAPTAKKQR